MASSCIHTPTLRFKLLDLTAGSEGTDYGDGTIFPLKVTPDQLAEIMFRVKRSWVTAGGFSSSSTIDFNTTGECAVNVGSGATSPAGTDVNAFADMYIYPGGSAFEVACLWRVGYCIGPSTTSLADPTAPDKFFQPEYDLPGGLFLGYYFPGIGTHYHRDVDDDEAVMWFLQPNTDLWYTEAGEEWAGYWPDEFLTGYTQHMLQMNSNYDETVLGTEYYHVSTVVNFDGLIAANDGSLNVDFSGDVAWVDVTGSQNPFDPGNELYVGVIVTMAGGGYSTYVSSYQAQMSLPTDTGGVAKFIGHFGQLTCPMYYEADNLLDVMDSFTDIVIEAKKWWPYKDGPPINGPVWNENTGAAL